jgi:putative nucleotidyltransferase with HDIG domain
MPNPTRAEAQFLMESWTASDSLRKHMLAVEVAVRAYAVRFGEDPERWGITGLLHDFDYERFPNAEQAADAEHPAEGVRYLRSLGVDEDICEAILGHAHYTGEPRTSLLAKTLFACDELTGLLTACALVKPSRSLADVEVPGVRKKLKDKAFARGVSRDDIVSGAADLGIALDEHIAFVLAAMRDASDALGLDGRLASTLAEPHDSTPLTGGA